MLQLPHHRRLTQAEFLSSMQEEERLKVSLQFCMTCTANEGPLRIQYKCLVPIYVFPEMKLCSLVISKAEL
jgi:hypothetical protein